MLSASSISAPGISIAVTFVFCELLRRTPILAISTAVGERLDISKLKSAKRGLNLMSAAGMRENGERMKNEEEMDRE